jgi:serine protease Do
MMKLLKLTAAVFVLSAFINSGPATAASSMPGSFSELVKRVAPAVVNISTTQLVKPQAATNDELTEEFYRRFFGGAPREQERKSLGSGFIISPDGYILTNSHVVANAKDIQVKLLDGTVHQASVIGSDEKTDLALIRIKADGLPTVTMGDSDALQVGDWVIAIGNPFGLSRTVTAGIVSAKGREIGAGPFDDFIQTDAPINPGNSGGPLFDEKGEVVGINSAMSAAGQNIGFAIPINIAKIVVSDLKEKGKVVRGWLGASAQVVTPELAEAFKIQPKGLVVTSVEKGSPADEGGLKTGDVILEFAGKKIEHPSEMPWLVASSRVGSKVPVKIIRAGKEMTLQVTIAALPETPVTPARMEETLGFTVVNLTPELARQLNMTVQEGVLVSQVSRDSQAAENGIRPGDLIAEVNGRPVRNVEEFQNEIKGAKPGSNVLFYVQKPTGALFVPIKIK